MIMQIARIFTVVIMALVLTNADGLAQGSPKTFKSGNDLVQMMPGFERMLQRVQRGDQSGEFGTVAVEGIQYATFLNYVLGVFDATSAWYGNVAGVTQFQVAAVVAKYLKEHPELWNYPAAILVQTALLQAFPRQ